MPTVPAINLSCKIERLFYSFDYLMMKIINSPIKFDAPAAYKIVVQGNLPEELYPYFANMKIVKETCKNGMNITLLTGYTKDQADLAGIFNILYEFHYPILLVEHLAGKISEAEPIKNSSNPK